MRNTKVRTAILAIFKEGVDPITASDVLKKLSKQGIAANKTTIYRELTFLTKNSLIREVVWDDSIVRYEQADPNCHHHAVCKHCGNVEALTLDEATLFHVIEQKSNFKVQKHIVEFFGLCTNCQ